MLRFSEQRLRQGCSVRWFILGRGKWAGEVVVESIELLWRRETGDQRLEVEFCGWQYQTHWEQKTWQRSTGDLHKEGRGSSNIKQS